MASKQARSGSGLDIKRAVLEWLTGRASPFNRPGASGSRQDGTGVVAPQLAEADQAVIDEARAAREKLRQAEQAASKASRAAVDDLRSQGMTVRDVARLVGVTPSRVSQLS
ncbi:MAG: hypothetical protein LBU05_04650 [Bifidobacteriaceae bacterium]|nr:hypothetical protein [Bifidobacteriaceae bacterium]